MTGTNLVPLGTQTTTPTVVSNDKTHLVSIMRDSALIFPDLWLDVYIGEGEAGDHPRFARMFTKAACKRAKTPYEADLVVFCGGPDVNPIYYGEEKHSSVYVDNKRDEADIKLYEICLNEGIPMFGVCRGAQFLHVMNGGKLYQDIDGHQGDHQVWTLREGRQLGKVSSVHHQSVIPNKDGRMEVLAEAWQSKKRWRNDKEFSMRGTGDKDVEAFWYRDTCCFGVQGHPEYDGYAQFMQWTLNTLETLVVTNPDIDLIKSESGYVRRLRPELMAERDKSLVEKEAN
jgi:gamma-glutamyl-gamma-aminobutyrate hydrolase PuuD